jgi:hypothetical protein
MGVVKTVDEVAGERSLLRSPLASGGRAMTRMATVLVAVAIVVAACGSSPGSPSAPANPSTPSVSPTAAPSSLTGIVAIAQPSTVDAMGWSPDSQHLFIAGDGIEVFDRQGIADDDLPAGTWAAWMGSGAIAAGTPAAANVGYGSVSIDAPAGGVVRLPGSYALDFVGAPNELALVPASASAPAGTGTFQVWRGGRMEGPYPGTPLAWSTDGSRLIATVGAVAYAAPLPGAAGIVEAAAGTPSGGRIRIWTFPGAVPGEAVSTVAVDPRYPPIFSPDGQTIAVPCGLSAASPDCAATVIDTGTLQAQVAGSQPPGLGLSWLSSGELLLASPAYPQARPLPAWSPRGTRQTALTGAWAMAGATGLVALETAAMGEPGATQVMSPTSKLLATIAGAIELHWSPDGSCLLVRVDPQAPLLLYGARP